MKLEIAQAIVDAAEEIGIEEFRLREDYSGRGMFGKTTTGIVYDNLHDLLQAVALASVRVKEVEDEMDERGEQPVPLTHEQFIDGLPKSGDSMGRDSSIAY